MAATLDAFFHEIDDDVKLEEFDSTEIAAMQYNAEEVFDEDEFEFEYEPQEGVDYFEEEDDVQEFEEFDADEDVTEFVAMQGNVVVFDDEDEYEPQEGVDYFEEEEYVQEDETFESDDEEVTEFGSIQDNNVEIIGEDEYETQPGIDYIDDKDDDDDVQDSERFNFTEGTGVAATIDNVEVEGESNEIEGINKEDSIFFKDSNVNGYYYLTGDKGFEEIYTDDLFMSSVSEGYLYNFGDDGGDDDKDEKEISTELNLKRRKVYAVRNWPNGCGPNVTRAEYLNPVQEECSEEKDDGRSIVLGLKTPELDIGLQVPRLEKKRKFSANSPQGSQAPDSRKDSQMEVVLALPAPQFSPWINSKGRLKKGRRYAC